MKRRIWAAATLAIAIGVATAPAEAAVSAVGWWSRNPTASAPEGGMQVANGLDGVISFGAVRAVENGEDIATATLTLQETGQALNGSGASLQACPAAGTWDAGKGEWADRPKDDCKAGTVALTRNAQGQWTGDVTSVLTGETPAVAVVPGEGANVFQVAFGPPTLDVTTSGSSDSFSSSSSDFDASEFTSSGSSSSSDSSGGFSGSSDSSSFDSGSSTFVPSSGSFSDTSGSTGTFAPSVEAAPATPQEAAAPADAGAAGDAGGAAGSTFVARQAAAPPLEVGGNKWAQFGLFLLIAGAAGTIAGVGRNRLTARSA